MPAAEMMTGVTIGEISRPLITARPGRAGLLRPSAARVPSTVARAVADRPMNRLLSRA